MNILHIHQDYPDNTHYPYTKAVSNLIAATRIESSEVGHFVVSINRTSNPLKVRVKPFDDGLSIIYWGIPLPYIYIFTLWLCHLLILFKIKDHKFDVVHGHKLTTEGYLAFKIAKAIGVPYIVSIRGGSDQHNFNRLSIHKSIFLEVYNNAQLIFWVSPWMKFEIEQLLGHTLTQQTLLPNICDIDLNDNAVYSTNLSNTHFKFLTVLSFHQYKRKGILELIQAFAQLNESGVDAHLDIYGTGPQWVEDIIQSEIKSLNINNIQLKGQVSQQHIRSQMKNSIGFLLPSINETFGMAYIEALSVGCPIMYTKGTGVDGFFDEYTIGFKVSSQNPKMLYETIQYFITQKNTLSQGFEAMHRDKVLQQFQAHNVAKMYLHKIMEQIA